MYGYIYKTTNLINGKIYIGQKKSSYFLGNDYLGSGKYLKCAINKYGVENFEVQLIKECATKQQLDELEKFYILQFNSIDKNIGYNIAEGAIGGDTYSGLSKEDKLIRSNKLKQYHKDMRLKNIRYVCIHKEDINKRVLLEDLPNYIADGWIKGRSKHYEKLLSESRKDIIHSQEWCDNIKRGWKNRTMEQIEETRRKHSEATKKQMQNTPKEQRIKRAKYAAKVKDNKNRIWVHKDEIHKFINKQELSNYIDNGYILGLSEMHKMHLSIAQKGKPKPKGFIYVYKDNTCIRIDKNKLLDYLNCGWQKGNLYLRGIKRNERRK